MLYLTQWKIDTCQIDTGTCVKELQYGVYYILCILHPTCTLHPILPCFIVANFRKIPLALLKICLFLYLQSIKDIDPCDPDNDQM